MSFRDTVALKGKLTITLNGEVVQEIKNLVVTAGKGWIADRMQGVTAGVMTHMAIGTGTTAADVAQTALVTEVARVALGTSGGVVAGFSGRELSHRTGVWGENGAELCPRARRGNVRRGSGHRREQRCHR